MTECPCAHLHVRNLAGPQPRPRPGPPGISKAGGPPESAGPEPPGDGRREVSESGGLRAAASAHPERTPCRLQGSASWPVALSSCLDSHCWSPAACSSAPRTSPMPGPTPAWPPTLGGSTKPRLTWSCGVSVQSGNTSHVRACVCAEHGLSPPAPPHRHGCLTRAPLVRRTGPDESRGAGPREGQGSADGATWRPR